ncbi:uncharacterized protein MKK02DRAFT_45125 [Dioszegia hungarica]|uniref:F-box domain-containing protein n=1 Tax=Dioszegia hungarica TaxID=4972 RepID=A0AA38LVB6_9TREE|nr:uncharacterized protein MKK02DRAFT_45125 [Dioszegia hungarica]KAI9636418.1 hypothetical protein MKK02DRAFT_45125 [Dioszegia hungarica]
MPTGIARPSFLTLPQDILLSIVHLLDRTDHVLLLRVHSTIYRMVGPLLYRNLQISDWYINLADLLPSSSAARNFLLHQVEYLAWDGGQTLEWRQDWSGMGESEMPPSQCSGQYLYDVRPVPGLGVVTSMAYPSPSVEPPSMSAFSNFRLPDDPSSATQPLPGLRVLRMPLHNDLTSCQMSRPCSHCDFFRLIRPEVWVIDQAGDVGPLHAHMPPSLKMLVVYHASFETDYHGLDVWNTFRIEPLLSTLPAHINLTLILGLCTERTTTPKLKPKGPLKDIARICANSRHKISFAVPLFRLINDPTGGHPNPSLLGNIFDLDVIRRETLHEMLKAGCSVGEITTRLERIAYVSLKELEAADWAPVMGSPDSVKWLGAI